MANTAASKQGLAAAYEGRSPDELMSVSWAGGLQPRRIHSALCWRRWRISRSQQYPPLNDRLLAFPRKWTGGNSHTPQSMKDRGCKNQEPRSGPPDLSPPSRRGTAIRDLADGSPRSGELCMPDDRRCPGRVEGSRMVGTKDWK